MSACPRIADPVQPVAPRPRRSPRVKQSRRTSDGQIVSYETATMRVSDLRAQLGLAPGRARPQDGRGFDAELARAGAGAASGSQAGAAGAGAMTGLPTLTVEQQYQLLGIAVPRAPLPGTAAAGMASADAVGATGRGGGGVGARMVRLAQAEIGVRESPSGSNNSPRIREYRRATDGAENIPGPWCAYFVSWLAKGAGAPIGAGGNGTGYVPTLEAWGKQNDRYIDPSNRPSPGDIVIFDWEGDGTSDHTGIVERVAADGTVHTIEGNSSNSVRRRSYSSGSNDIRGYVTV